MKAYIFIGILVLTSQAKAQTVQRAECANLAGNSNILFCEDFEASNWQSKWYNGFGYSEELGKTIINAGVTQDSGNHVIQISGTGGNFRKNFTYAEKLWTRWYMKYNNGFTFSEMNHGSGVYMGNVGVEDYYGAPWSGGNIFRSNNVPLPGYEGHVGFQMEHATDGKMYNYSYYRGMYQNTYDVAHGCVEPDFDGRCHAGDPLPCIMGSSCKNPDHLPPNSTVPPIATANKWYCIEQYVDLGIPTTDAENALGLSSGEFQSYIDSIQITNLKTNKLQLRTSYEFQHKAKFMFQLYFHSGHSSPGIQYDNLVVSKTRVGCGSSAPAKPSAPTNVTVQ